MFFKNEASLEQMVYWVSAQLSALKRIANNGIDIEIRPHKRQRSSQQNRLLMAVMVAQVKFYHETGFMPDGCEKWMMRTNILKEYWKARFGIEHTSKLDTKAFAEFIDGIQRELVEESNGEWEILETDSAYLKSLIEGAGI
ncbi:MAG: hypothetical protein IKT32_02205 [Clostridia bacterium]|nr:hypothetical protein [Clostridia bacterium]